MAHFALIDENSIVINVLVISNEDILDENGKESEEQGAEFCNSLIPGKWLQTSYNRNLRKNFAGVGYYYDNSRDAFIPPKPFDSWILDEETCRWFAPIPIPENGNWAWDALSQSWIEVELDQIRDMEA